MAYSHAVSSPHSLTRENNVRAITNQDVLNALHRGFSDYWDNPTHYAFSYLIYPVIGVVLAFWTSRANLLPLLYPLASGFALLGPFVAIGLYEISRRRESDRGLGEGIGTLLQPHRFGPLALLGLLLLAVFVMWLVVAEALYRTIMGAPPPADLGAFFREVVGTSRGWTLIVVGNLVGLLFAAFVLATTVVAFPMLVDQPVSTRRAIETSIAAVRANPIPMAVWGLIVAALLAIGIAPLFLGLIIVLPVLGHATWHLYRTVVTPDGDAL